MENEVENKINDENKTRQDGVTNAMTGKGIRGRDKTASNNFTGEPILNDDTVEDLWRSEGLASTIIERPADDMTRKGFKIVGDSDRVDDINDFLKEKGFHSILNQALKQNRAYGGSLILVGAKDGKKLDTEINWNKVRDIAFFKAYGRRFVQPTDFDMDIESGNYSYPRMYSVSREGAFHVHNSRVLRFDGRITDYNSFVSNNYWGLSVMQDIKSHLLNLLSGLKDGEQVISEMSVGVLKMKNLFQLASTKEGEETIRNRLDLLDLSKNNQNTVAVDTEEEFTRENTTISGVEKVIEMLMYAISGATLLPSTVLFGRSPAGQNSTGESDLTLYYDRIESEQQNVLKPKILQIAKNVAQTQKLNINPDDIKDVEFEPLKTMTSKERSEILNTFADAFTKLIKSEVLTPEEVTANFSKLTGFELNYEYQNNE